MSEISTADLKVLNNRLDGHEGDMREIKDSILGLDGKIENAVSSLAREVRTAIDALRTQFSERQRPQWGVIFAGASVFVAVLGFIGGQALSPVQADIKLLKDQIVPREEINYRAEVTNRRFIALEDAAKLLAQRRYDEMQAEIRELRGENRELKRPR